MTNFQDLAERAAKAWGEPVDVTAPLLRECSSALAEAAGEIARLRAHAEAMEFAAEKHRLQASVLKEAFERLQGRMPKTADGVPIWLSDTVYVPDRQYCIAVGVISVAQRGEIVIAESTSTVWRLASDVYSTREAAENARTT